MNVWNMKESQFYEEYIKVLKNETKASIIALLIQRGKMTVTDMSKYIHTSRSNLYHNAKELVEIGFLNEPESVVVKNYVEKYYTINSESLSGLSQEKLYDELLKFEPVMIKNLLLSALGTYSFLLKLLGEEVAMMKDDDVKKIPDYIRRGEAQLIYSRMSRDTYLKAIDKIKEVMEILETSSDRDVKAEESQCSLMIVALP